MENQILLEKIGQTKNQKLIDDCYKIYRENFRTKFPEFFVKNNQAKMMALVTVKEKDEVKGIGMSKVDDLLLDSWGTMFGAILDCFSGSFQMTNTSGTLHTMRIWGSQTTSMFITNHGGVGTRIQVGTGTTTPARTDFNIETLVQTLTSGLGGYNSGLGKVDIPANAIAGSTFTISETGLFGKWPNTSNIIHDFMISHDLISPAVAVSSGQSIDVDYSLLLS